MISIRQATKKDLPEIGQLFSDVYTSKEFDKFTPESSSRYAEWLFNRCPELAFVAEEGGKIVGIHLAATKPWWDGPHVVDVEIAVAKDFRNQGVGLKLKERSLEKAKEMGAVEVEAVTFVHPENALWDVKPEYLNLEWHLKNGYTLIPDMAFMSGSVDEMLEKVKKRLAKQA